MGKKIHKTPWIQKMSIPQQVRSVGKLQASVGRENGLATRRQKHKQAPVGQEDTSTVINTSKEQEQATTGSGT